MRSVVVVLPASMCAIIPILRMRRTSSSTDKEAVSARPRMPASRKSANALAAADAAAEAVRLVFNARAIAFGFAPRSNDLARWRTAQWRPTESSSAIFSECGLLSIRPTGYPRGGKHVCQTPPSSHCTAFLNLARRCGAAVWTVELETITKDVFPCDTSFATFSLPTPETFYTCFVCFLLPTSILYLRFSLLLSLLLLLAHTLLVHSYMDKLFSVDTLR